MHRNRPANPLPRARTKGAFNLWREERMERINRRYRPLPIKQQKVLQWLLARTQNINDVLRETTPHERGDGTEFAAEILEEGAQEGRVEG